MTTIRFHKPFDVLCQFSPQCDDKGSKQTLADYIPLPDVYAAGRLDRDSEGLLLLTDNGALQHHIAHPQHGKSKVYWVQVDGAITDDAITQLRRGVLLKDGQTKAAQADKMAAPANLWARQPAVRFRANIPTSWLRLEICEGKNRQVRRMTAAVGFPTLRLIRYAIGTITLDGLTLGGYEKIDEGQFNQDKSGKSGKSESGESRSGVLLSKVKADLARKKPYSRRSTAKRARKR
ncbi:MAG: pseudouridine synthase [Mariprofundaceae bacterium]|nr:pseudouridine synthase [Mariprofundaceae bacterium]